MRRGVVATAVTVAVTLLVTAGATIFVSGISVTPSAAASPVSHSPLAGLAYASTDTAPQEESLFGSDREVRVRAWFSGPVAGDGSRPLSVQIRTAKGWHVNANPPSLGFLIPTVVSAQVEGKPVPIRVSSYPKGSPSDIVFSHTDIRVYTNNTTLTADVPSRTLRQARAAGELTIVVQAQACSEKRVCLPPANVQAHVPLSAGGKQESSAD